MLKLNIEKKEFPGKIIFEQTEIVIQKGAFVGIKGASGSGKSTLLKMIGLLEPFEGTYSIDEKVLVKKERENVRRNHFAYLFQEPELIPYLNVEDNIRMPLKNLKIRPDREKTDELMKLMNIFDLKDRYPEKLSGGEAQRVALCRAVMSDREYILCDEPTGSLDPENAHIVMEYLKKINQSLHKTIIMVTHNLEYDVYFSELFGLKERKIGQYEKDS